MTFVADLIGYTDLDFDLAAILEPAPTPTCTNEHGEYDDWISALEERASAIRLMGQERAEGASDDPLLHALEHLRCRRNEIEQQMILLVAYMREKIGPRPYTLKQIADAAGLSISGTRTFYDEEDVELLTQRITRAKETVGAMHAARGTVPGLPTVHVNSSGHDLAGSGDGK